MKKLVILFSLTMTSLGLAQGKITRLTADIQNMKGNVIEIYGDNNFEKKIKGVPQGHFEGDLQLKEGLYVLDAGQNLMQEIYLKSGDNVGVKADTNKFYETLIFTGDGAEGNNLLVKRTLEYGMRDSIYRSIYKLDDVAFNKALVEINSKDLATIENPNFDSHFISIIKKQVTDEEQNCIITHSNHMARQKLNNTTAASFEFENHQGGKTKLEDFKGKYVLIDVWATGCGPCLREIPALKTIHKKYHDKNIVFVGVAMGEPKNSEYWKTFVTDQQLPGVQLSAQKMGNNSFSESYLISDLPRFILIGPNGKIINSDISWPSDPKLQEELDRYL